MRWLIFLALVFISTADFSLGVAQELNRGLVRDESEPTSFNGKYPKQWAVIVGVNYTANDRKVNGSEGTLQELKNAESDAEAVHAILSQKFGYGIHGERENDAQTLKTVLLLGKNATKAKIETQLGELATSNEIGSDDCLFVFFSGHGHSQQQEKKDGKRDGYLLPVDVKWNSTTSTLNPATAVAMEDVVKLLKKCEAKHKLLVLDCCHSGAVFHVTSFGADSTSTSVDDENTFSSPAFQIITASRDNQRASDGKYGHSPFTYGLLQSLNAIPLDNEHYRGKGQRQFTATKLFSSLENHLAGQGYQNPMCRHVTEAQGQFHFVPAANAIFGDDDSNVVQRNRILAMAPTTFGNWWPQEVPWFMPSLRRLISDELPASRATRVEIDRESLKQAAYLVLKKVDEKTSGKRGEHFDEQIKKRYAHFKRILEAKDRESLKRAIEEVIRDLQAFVLHENEPKPDADPMDLHYLAVLCHLHFEKSSKEFFKTKDYYEQALKLYKQVSNPEMELLCRLDFGMWNLANNQFEDAKREFEQILTFGNNGVSSFPIPRPFLTFTLCKYADTFRREGRFGMSEKKTQEALQELVNWDKQRESLLFSNILKGNAWGYMESWNFKKAGDNFRESGELLRRLNNRDESKIDELHIEHGLAMIDRFDGRSADALRRYRTLTERIMQEINSLRDRSENVENYVELRELLYERLTNSLDRQGDCSLFSSSPDYADAADDYRRAYLAAANRSKSARDTARIESLYRRAVSLALNIFSQKKTVLQEFETDVSTARALIEEADSLSLNSVETNATNDETANSTSAKPRTSSAASEGACPLDAHSKYKNLPSNTKIIRGIADFTVTILEEKLRKANNFDSTPATGNRPCKLDAMASLMERIVDNPGRLDRDGLERTLFYYRNLIIYRSEFGFTPNETAKHVQHMLACCRAAYSHAGTESELRPFLRPYFDTAFLAIKELYPRNTKELVEIAIESITGRPYMKPSRFDVNTETSVFAGGQLVLYCVQGKCHLLLDACGISDSFEVDDVSPGSFIEALNGNELTLPDKLRKELQVVSTKIKKDERLVLRWRDPVSMPLHTDADVTFVASDVRSDLVTTRKPVAISPRFPFRLEGLITPKQIHDDAPLPLQTLSLSIPRSPALTPNEMFRSENR